VRPGRGVLAGFSSVQDLVLEHRDGLAQAVLPDDRLEGLDLRVVQRREERGERVEFQCVVGLYEDVLS
jgi:hypothetical protein